MISKNKEVLFVISQLGFGGAGKVLIFVANACVNNGYDVTIECLGSEQNTADIDSRINVEYLGYDPKSSNKIQAVLSRIKLLLTLRSKIKKTDSSIVISFLSDCVRITMMACMGLKKKIIGSERANPLEYSKKDFKKYSKAYEKCDCIVFQTQRAKSFFDENIRNKAKVIANPAVQREQAISPYKGVRQKIFVSAGRLHKQKRFDLLILAFKDVLVKYPDYSLLIYGDGHERKNLEELIAKHSLEKKVFIMPSEKDVMLHIYKATAFILSSDYEGIPNVVIESLMAGIPTIATDCEPGGPRLLLDNGRRGILVDVGDVDGISNAMIEYIENPELRDEHSKLGLEIIELYRPELIQQKWMDIVDNI